MFAFAGTAGLAAFKASIYLLVVWMAHRFLLRRGLSAARAWLLIGVSLPSRVGLLLGVRPQLFTVFFFLLLLAVRHSVLFVLTTWIFAGEHIGDAWDRFWPAAAPGKCDDRGTACLFDSREPSR